ncbi:MAG: helix-turn-helix transcriptional regulator [Candidatus Contendobacter sp.]
MNFSSLSSPRIREERERLNLSQAQIAEKCGVSREIWGRYERGQAVPGGEVLFALAMAGADVQYIITGQRSNAALPQREAALLDNYRHTDDRGKRVIEQTAFVVAEPFEVRQAG